MTDATTTEPSITDLPLGGLPPADPTLLASAPLEVAVIEVRFTATTTEIGAETAARVRDALAKATGAEHPSIQQAVQGTVQVNVGPQAIAPSFGGEVKGWQIASSDGRRNVTLMPGLIILQTADYERWSLSLRGPLEAALDVLVTDLGPTLVQRIGLRYVDRFQDPTCTTVEGWRGKIDDSLLGPALNSVFGPKVRGAQQHVEIGLDAHHGAVLRHGPAVDPSVRAISYLVDLDVFNLTAEPFDADYIVKTAERLNRTALSLFQACVSAEYLRSLQGGESEK
jgi:uncharacterized protein (TIGR04255 family)